MRDELIEQLLRVPLDRFVEDRNRLAREARASGDRETAAWLQTLRRPAPQVWALDQVAHGDPHRVRTLTNLARRLADAQSRAVQDRAAAQEMQELGREVQRGVDDVVRRGMQVLRDAGHGSSAQVQLEMTSTLRAALAAGDGVREQLEQGRLLAPVEPQLGFGAPAAATDDEPIATPRTQAAKPQPEQGESPQLAEMREAAAGAADAAAAADREVFQRRTEQRRADEHVAELRSRMQLLQAELSDAETQSKSAADAVRAAVEASRAARREADRLQSALPPD